MRISDWSSDVCSSDLIEVTAVAVRDIDKAKRLVGDSVLLTQDGFEVVRHPDIDIVVELIGGDTLARDLIMEAIDQGKHVVTANKALLAKHGNEIFAEIGRASCRERVCQ